jgi:hypothetical protein
MKRAGWLEPWRAGWINLKAMLLYGADFFLMKPGLALLLLGLSITLPATFGPVTVGPATLSLYWSMLGLTFSVVGLQSFYLACVVQVMYGYSQECVGRWLRLFAYDRMMSISSGLLLVGVALARIHDNMKQELLGLGARIDDIFCCVHEERTCNCRKPRPGMVIEAASKWDIDLTQSVLIGDSRRDEELALACGMAFVAVHEGTVIGRIPAQVYAHAE